MAVDLSVLGLLVGIRILVITGAEQEVLRPARLLLLFSSTVSAAWAASASIRENANRVPRGRQVGVTAERMPTPWAFPQARRTKSTDRQVDPFLPGKLNRLILHTSTNSAHPERVKNLPAHLDRQNHF